jgi:glycosyltransferase involved in cell wall biosynthesis
MQKLLTIGVPTYNRSFLLDEFFRNLEEAIKDYPDHIEVIVVDNASSDETEKVCRENIERLQKFVSITYVRNKENLGPSRSLVNLFYLSQARFFTFVGDDDKLHRQAINKIIKVLDSQTPPSAIIQSKWSHKKTFAGLATFKQALEYFYEYGNGAAGIIDRQAAVQAIESRKLRSRIEQLVWPQTVIGFLAIHDLLAMGQKPYLLPEIVMSPAQDIRYSHGNTIYWRRSMGDMVRAAWMVDEYLAGNQAQQAFINLKPKGKHFGYLRCLASKALVEGKVVEGKDELVKAFLGSNRFLTKASVFWVYLFSSPAVAVAMAYFYLLFMKRLAPREIAREIGSYRASFHAHSELAGVRKGDWF